MIKELFQFRKEDALMWGGIGIFALILIAAFSIMPTSEGLVVKDLIGLVVVLILPGYIVVKLYFDNVQVSENLTKNPDINKAIDKLIVSLGVSIACIIPMNFVWNYLLTMGGGDSGPANCNPESGKCASNIWGNVDEEMIYTGNASWRSLFTVILVIAIAIGYKIYQLKFSKK